MAKTPAAKTPAAKAPAKKAAPKAAATKSAAPKTGGIHAPVTPSDILAAIVGKGPMPRSEIVSKLWEYIKKNNLQNPQNKREILADAGAWSLQAGAAAVPSRRSGSGRRYPRRRYDGPPRMSDERLRGCGIRCWPCPSRIGKRR